MANQPEERTYDSIKIGDAALFTIQITGELVEKFSEVSGDVNPIHMDEEYASHTPLGERIAHGMIVGALFSRLIGMHLPGKYSLYLSQTLRFHNPIPLGTEITIRGEVTHKTDAVKTIGIRATAEYSSSKKILVSGEALAQVLK